MITSTNNQQIKNIMKLNQKARARKEQGLFVVEGIKMFLEAPQEWIHSVYLSEEAERSILENPKAREKLQGCGYETVEKSIFQKISDTQTPQGILCLVKKPVYQKETLYKKNGLYILIEDLQDPGNLGTIFRTAEGAGVDGILMSANTVDLYNPKTVRSTMGSIYRMPHMYVEDLQAVIAEMQQAGVTIFATHLKGEKWHYEQDYTGSCGFLIGNEGNGLKEETAALADTYIKIPMEGKLESLNAAVATAICIYEAYRQRHLS